MAEMIYSGLNAGSVCQSDDLVFCSSGSESTPKENIAKIGYFERRSDLIKLKPVNLVGIQCPSFFGVGCRRIGILGGIDCINRGSEDTSLLLKENLNDVENAIQILRHLLWIDNEKYVARHRCLAFIYRVLTIKDDYLALIIQGNNLGLLLITKSRNGYRIPCPLKYY